jgi:exodeoxyribonuclease III
MKIATWNVNSIRVRLPRLLAWLQQHQPDVVGLQETKTLDGQFPFAELEQAGYCAETWGQKTYNGVALLSKRPLLNVTRGFTNIAPSTPGSDSEQARCIAGSLDGVRVVTVYVPNGSEVGSDKYAYKLAWLAQLATWLPSQQQGGDQLLLCGDMNVAPTDADVHDPDAWRETVLCSTAERAALLTATVGLSDLVRKHHSQPGLFTWWDYRGIAFFKNLGLRIDHIFATPELAQRCTSAIVDRPQRKGEQPSDHAPVIAEFE